MKSQNLQVLDHLRKKGSITDLEALKHYDIRRLGARIYDIRKVMDIKTTMITTKSKKRIARYSLT